jgi:hypothetical protein
LSVPVFAQFLTAPLHIHALDFYTRPGASNAERATRIKEEMGKICFARGLRILPAFGLGSYSNNKLREWFIRQPDEELLLSRQLRRRMSELQEKLQESSFGIVSFLVARCILSLGNHFSPQC